MIRCIEALHYRCLRNVRQEIGPFQLLVGPNASGKSTLLDGVRFLGQLVSGGMEAAVRDRTENLRDLIWQHEGDRFELAVELAIPENLLPLLKQPLYDVCRYETAVGIDPETKENVILSERVLLKARHAAGAIPGAIQGDLFPNISEAPQTILTAPHGKGVKSVVNKVRGGNDNFYDETGKGWDHAFKLGPRKSALGNLPEDESKFPVSTWLKQVLIQGIESLVLSSERMRKPSPPGQPTGFRSDGSNLPWAIEALRKRDENLFEQWIEHIRTTLPDVKTIQTIERPEDKHRYLQIVYQTGPPLPSWVVSDGTLRLLALTLVAYFNAPGKIYLIEEPENGIHPQAVETVFQSLSSVYESQILCATHSPVVLSLAEPDQVLCFARSPEGATAIVRGSEHPNLKDWKRDVDLGTLFATGMLG